MAKILYKDVIKAQAEALASARKAIVEGIESSNKPNGANTHELAQALKLICDAELTLVAQNESLLEKE